MSPWPGGASTNRARGNLCCHGWINKIQKYPSLDYILHLHHPSRLWDAQNTNIVGRGCMWCIPLHLQTWWAVQFNQQRLGAARPPSSLYHLTCYCCPAEQVEHQLAGQGMVRMTHSCTQPRTLQGFGGNNWTFPRLTNIPRTQSQRLQVSEGHGLLPTRHQQEEHSLALPNHL